MPELPEIETVRTAMEMNIGARVQTIDVLREDILRVREYEPDEVHGQVICAISRRGKFLVISLEKDYCIVVHLGMSGRFYMQEESREVLEPHVHFILHLDNERKLIYRDTRRFGGIWLSRDAAVIFAQMGVEPLSADFTAEYLQKVLLNRKASIKTLLLNQKLIAGLGNIYADEALFEARIQPGRLGASLQPREIKRLHQAIRDVLLRSIERRGTTFRDYRDGFNSSGENQHFLNVYGREGLACPHCGREIEMERIGGRSSHYCARCQH